MVSVKSGNQEFIPSLSIIFQKIVFLWKKE